MIDLVLVKRDMLRFVQDVRAVTGIGQAISDHHVVLYKVRLVGTWIKRREVMDRARRIRSEKLREHQYREEYARSLEGKRIEWKGENNVEHIWEQVKRVMVENEREVCGSVRVGGGNSKSVGWNDQVKAAVMRKEDTWKKVMGARDEDARERCLEVHKEEKRKVKRCIQSKEEIQEHFGRKVNQDVNGKRKLFWKKVSKANGGKVENSNRIKDGNGRLILE